MIPEWLSQHEKYQPEARRDRHIDKSLLSIIGILSRIRTGSQQNTHFIYRVNPAVKFICTLATILFLSLSRSGSYVLLVDACAIFMVSLLSFQDIRRILGFTFVTTFATGIIVLPSALLGNLHNAVLLCMKIIGTMLLLNGMSYSTKWRHLTGALKLFHVPEVFILVFDLTIRYIVILGDMAVDMLTALKLRSVGGSSKQHLPLSRIIGTLFLTSKEMADDVYAAMECRGFTGGYTSRYAFKISFIELPHLAVTAMLIILHFIISSGGKTI